MPAYAGSGTAWFSFRKRPRNRIERPRETAPRLGCLGAETEKVRRFVAHGLQPPDQLAQCGLAQLIQQKSTQLSTSENAIRLIWAGRLIIGRRLVFLFSEYSGVGLKQVGNWNSKENAHARCHRHNLRNGVTIEEYAGRDTLAEA